MRPLFSPQKNQRSKVKRWFRRSPTGMMVLSLYSTFPLPGVKETEGENNVYVVFKWNIHWSAETQDGGEGGKALLRPPTIPFYTGFWTDI